MQRKEAPKPPKTLKKKEDVLPQHQAATITLHDDAQVGDVTSIAQLFHEYGGWHSTPAVVDRIQHCNSTDHNQDGLLLSYLIDNAMNGKGYTPLTLAIVRSSTRAKRKIRLLLSKS